MSIENSSQAIILAKEVINMAIDIAHSPSPIKISQFNTRVCELINSQRESRDFYDALQIAHNELEALSNNSNDEVDYSYFPSLLNSQIQNILFIHADANLCHRFESLLIPLKTILKTDPYNETFEPVQVLRANDIPLTVNDINIVVKERLYADKSLKKYDKVCVAALFSEDDLKDLTLVDILQIKNEATLHLLHSNVKFFEEEHQTTMNLEDAHYITEENKKIYEKASGQVYTDNQVMFALVIRSQMMEVINPLNSPIPELDILEETVSKNVIEQIETSLNNVSKNVIWTVGNVSSFPYALLEVDDKINIYEQKIFFNLAYPNIKNEEIALIETNFVDKTIIKPNKFTGIIRTPKTYLCLTSHANIIQGIELIDTENMFKILASYDINVGIPFTNEEIKSEGFYHSDKFLDKETEVIEAFKTLVSTKSNTKVHYITPKRFVIDGNKIDLPLGKKLDSFLKNIKTK